MVDVVEELLDVNVLGPIRLSWKGVRLPLKPAGTRILAYLAYRSGGQVQTVEIVTALWPDITEAKGKNRIRVALSAARETFASAGAPDPVRTLRGAYELDRSICQVDADVFEAHVRKARTLSRTNAVEAAAQYRAALEVFAVGVEPYADLLAYDFAVDENRRLSALRAAIASDLIEVEVETAPTESLIADIQRALDDDPLNERLHAAWMIAEYRAGRQSEALRIADRAREKLATETGLESHPFINRVEARILSQDPSLLGKPVRLPSHQRDQAPAYATSFVGRDSEIAQLRGYLTDSAPVTVVGPGGSGKTRLVVHCLETTDREARFIDLTRVRREGDIRPVIAAALGLDSSPDDLDRDLSESLRDHPQCLVLDNCEHVLDHAATFVRRAAHIPGVKVIATSREPLAVDGEAIVKLRGLGVSGRDIDVDFLSESALLFIDRARRSGVALELTDSAIADIERICSHRDGLPLAIELAASWVPFLSLEEIRIGLLEHVDVMVGTRRSESGRAESMEETLGWSYLLLGDREQLVFRRAALLESGFTLDLLILVCSNLSPGAVRSAHTRLVSHQLIDRTTTGSASRFGMLTTIKAFGSEHAESTDSDAVARALGRWAMDLAEDAWSRIDGEDREKLFRVLDNEIPNLLLSARLLLERDDPAVTMQLVSRLHGYINSRALIMDEVLELFRRAEGLVDRTGAKQSTRALIGAGLVNYHAGDLEYASHLLRRAIGLADGEGDLLAELNARHSLGRVLVHKAEIDEARAVLRRATELSRSLGDGMRLARDLSEQAGVEAPEIQLSCLVEAGELLPQETTHVSATYVASQNAWFRLGVSQATAGAEVFRHSLSEYRSQGSDIAVAEMLWGLADCHGLAGQTGLEINALREALDAARSSRNRASIAISTIRLAELVEDSESEGLLDEAAQAIAEDDLPLLGRLNIASGRVAWSSQESEPALTHFLAASDQFTPSAYPSWKATALLGAAMASKDGGEAARRYAHDAAVSFRSGLDGPFLLDGFVFPELGSLKAIHDAVEDLEAIAGSDRETEVLPDGLEGVRVARLALDRIVEALADL